MTSKIKALTTQYNGYRFRSRLEARWAVFFDALDIEYVYEKEGYDLGKAGRYLPDFWLPQVYMWAEVKPRQLSDDEVRKCMALAEGTDYECLVLVGNEVANHPYWAIYPGGQFVPLTDGASEEEREIDKAQRGILPEDGNYEGNYCCLTNYHNYPKNERRFYSSPGCRWSGASWDEECGDNDTCWDDTTEAMIAARSARFEFGE